MHVTESCCCAVPKRNVEKTPVVKTPHRNKTLQTSMAYSDAFTMKLLVINPTRLLLCNSICYLMASPSRPAIPPPPQILYQLQVSSLHYILLLLSIFHSCFSGFIFFNTSTRICSLRLDLNFRVSPIVLFFFTLTRPRRSTKACEKAELSLNPLAEVERLDTFLFLL